jgi:adenosylhomocysteine nucleosidase
MSAGKVLPAPEPVDVGIVAALPIEVGALTDLLAEKREYRDPAGKARPVIEGMLAGKRVALIVAGAGRDSAERGTARLLVGHRPRWIFSAGFGGALDPELRRGDAVVVREVLHDRGDGSTPDRLEVDFQLADPAGDVPGKRLRSGVVATVDRIARTGAEKKVIRERTGADAVDMETFAVARVCADRGVRFLGLRVVSDEADEDLPPEILTIVGPTGVFRFGATMGALWKRPSSVKDLWRLYEHAQGGADRLAALVRGLAEQLPC